MILDTTFIIDHFNGKPITKKVLLGLQEKNEPMFTTSISVFEIREGIRNKKEQEIFHKFFNSIDVTSFDKNAAEKAGEIQSELKRKGEIIDSEDAMIAGIAMLNSQAVLTKNEKHFKRIKGLKVVSY